MGARQDRESARVRILSNIVAKHKLHLGVLLLAHAELRAIRDPLIPSSLPSTSSPELRMEIEEELQDAIESVRKINNIGKQVVAKVEGRYTVYSRDGLDAKILTNIVKKTRDKASIPDEEFDYTMWASLLRYRALGLLNTNSAAIPNSIYVKMANAWSDGPVIEGFASLFNNSLQKYYGLFPDTEKAFGCIANFFALKEEEVAPGSLLICNPPYQVEIINSFVDKTLDLLNSSRPVCVLVVLPAFEVSDRENLNFHANCDEKYPSDYTTDVDTTRLKSSPHNRFCALYCKEGFPFWNMKEDKTMGITSALVLFLTNDPHMDVSILINILPPGKRISCTRGVKAIRTEVPLQNMRLNVKASNPWD